MLVWVKTRIWVMGLAALAWVGTALWASPERADPPGGRDMKIATFGAGCFWGVEEAFRKLPGVTDTAVGYMGGSKENPSYQDVCGGHTGHAEVVRVAYDPDKTGYGRLLEVFWAIHDPTTLNRQGPDVGSQYRSVVFFHDEAQEKAAKVMKEALEKNRKFGGAIVTEIVPAKTFWRAEEYHQRYLEKHGRVHCRF